MRLAATKVRLELDDRIAACTRQPLDGADEQTLEALGQVRAAEELRGLLVFVAAFAKMNLPEVRCELRLLIPSTRDVLVRRHDFPPRLQVTGDGRLDGHADRPPLLAAHLLVEAQTQQ